MDYATALLAKLPGAPKRDYGLRRLVDTLESYLSVEQIESIMNAYEFGAEAHKGQTRQSGALLPNMLNCSSVWRTVCSWVSSD